MGYERGLLDPGRRSLVFGRRHERHIEELDVILGRPFIPITASGAVMGFPRKRGGFF
jgi:hypothetical protein